MAVIGNDVFEIINIHLFIYHFAFPLFLEHILIKIIDSIHAFRFFVHDFRIKNLFRRH